MRIISGKARGTKLYTLEGMNTRPTLDRVKESLFNIIQNEIQEKSVLDLFAGSGALGLEAYSRGAKEVILCDNNINAIKIINKNIEKLRSQNVTLAHKADFKAFLNQTNKKFDIIFLDPPYKTDFIYKSVEIIKNRNLLKENGLIILETDEKDRVLNELSNLIQVEKNHQNAQNTAENIAKKMAKNATEKDEQKKTNLEKNEQKKINEIKITDIREYGRATLIFLRKE